MPFGILDALAQRVVRCGRSVAIDGRCAGRRGHANCRLGVVVETRISAWKTERPSRGDGRWFAR